MRTSVLGFMSLVLATGVAFAHPLEKREPGLWEITTNQNTAVTAMMDGMQEILKNLPPAQRKQMEQMMQSKGVSMSDPTVIKQCLTPELIAREFQPYSNDPEMQCSSTAKDVSGSETKFNFSCSNGEEKWKGKGRVWDATPTRYKGEMTMEGMVEGRPINMSMTHEARWLGADCKGLKPVG